jgi:glycosyltransferase involved in cell wall biosynthesis
VLDNNATDRTAEAARHAGAIVLPVRQQGKGAVVRFMFQHVDADIYVMVDGDGTYPAASIHSLIAPIANDEADMVVGSRLHNQSQSRFRFRNRLGNKLFLSALNTIFRVRLTDILSGYRTFNRKLVKSLPLFGGGFEIETELTIKALERGYRIIEVPVNLGERPSGSRSKIRVVRDGTVILHTILALFRDYKPLTFFGMLGLFLIAVGSIPGIIVVLEFIQTGFIRHLPSAVLAVGLELSGMLLLMAGLILHTIARRFQELDYHLQVLMEERNYNKKD